MEYEVVYTDGLYTIHRKIGENATVLMAVFQRAEDARKYVVRKANGKKVTA
jgi:hypothetical protein